MAVYIIGSLFDGRYQVPTCKQMPNRLAEKSPTERKKFGQSKQCKQQCKQQQKHKSTAPPEYMAGCIDAHSRPRALSFTCPWGPIQEKNGAGAGGGAARQGAGRRPTTGGRCAGRGPEAGERGERSRLDGRCSIPSSEQIPAHANFRIKLAATLADPWRVGGSGGWSVTYYVHQR